MPGKIGHLTLSQEQLLIEWSEEWSQLGLCAEPVDRERTQAAITAMYAQLGATTPRFLWVQSPAALALAIVLLQDGDRLESLWSSTSLDVDTPTAASILHSLRESIRDSLGDAPGLWRKSLSQSLDGESVWASLRPMLASFGHSLIALWKALWIIPSSSRSNALCGLLTRSKIC